MTDKAITTFLTLACGLSTCALTLASATEVANPADRTTHSLFVSAAAAKVEVTPRSGRRASIVLPAIEYVFSVNALCATSFEPKSVSVTVADSRSFLGPNELVGADVAPEVRLTVPASQIAPLIVADFCIAASDQEAVPADGPAATGESMTVPATLSASASLLCVSEGKQELLYTTTPLDVTLTCTIDESVESED